MLVLNRKVGECIVIDDKITVTVLEVQGSRMRLGIEAPADVPIHRREVYDRLTAWEPQAPEPHTPESQTQTGPTTACCPQV